MKKNIIGLTGGIGSGKSTVASMFAELGAHHLDADEISRNALDMESPCYAVAVALLGREILCGEGTINRQTLAELVFSDDRKRQVLNDIVHPYVLEQMQQRTAEIVEQDKNACVVWDVPLLFESGWEAYVGCSILVIAPLEMRLARLDMPKEDALKRMDAQWSDEEKALRADYILSNEDSRVRLWFAVQAQYREWRGKHFE